jgi:1-acyl-sn-glycerol-3-phosphate acyltransferase
MLLRAAAARLVVRLIFRVLFRIRVDGGLPHAGPALVVANHQGWADAFLIAAAFPLRTRIRFLGDRSATMTVWWKRAVLRATGLVIPIDRTRVHGDRHALSSVMTALDRRQIVVIFAEGRVSHAEAALAPFARGVGYLAVASGASVVPLWVAGTAELYLGRPLTLVVGARRAVAKGSPTKARTLALAHEIHDDLAAIALPWTEAVVSAKHMRWLTTLF